MTLHQMGAEAFLMNCGGRCCGLSCPLLNVAHENPGGLDPCAWAQL